MKFCGNIGFGIQEETFPHSGIYIDSIVERKYYGDFIRASKRENANQDTVNDNLSLSHQVDIVADAFLYNNYQNIKYAEVEGAKWKVTYVEIRHPRLRISFGGVWNGQ